ncbi:hypothetical protein NL676_020359 [Syzygium grande]|nr:hypothetical protein NL676_020359 [Syzygium grande]
MGVCYGTPDFPTPSYTGSLKSGMKLTISTSSSSAASNSHDLLAARDRKAFGDGKIVADPSLTVFSFAELKEATKNFHRSALIGEGGFGCVFKGMLHGKQQSGRTETIIAVKMLNQSGNQGPTESRREIDFLGRLSHPNLAKLLGFCQEDTSLALVYEFMPMGSLGNQLFGSWNPSLIHCPVLFQSYTAKLSDFGLVRSDPPGDKSHISTQFVGTIGYAAREYLQTGHLTVKSEVYSFGVVLLEILTGLRALDMSRPVGNLGEWATPRLSQEEKLRTVMDSRLEGEYYIHSAFQIAQLALKCLKKEPRSRPNMTEVVEELESIEAAGAKRI